MSESLSECRPTFTTRPPHFPRKIALEEAVNTSVFNATRTSQPLQAYLENNFWVTTSGVMSTRTLHDTLSIFGADKAMWSCDYPYESYQETGGWFDHLEIDDQTRAKLGWQNAERPLRL
jgi:predicted TIM-barrel fold metal-dependent hydrolase